MRADTQDPFKTLYPPIEPYSRQHLETGDGHSVYVEQSGNPHGRPVLFVHGGPGGGTSGVQRRFFDPRKYRIILFDQRGCGRSQPAASLANNTTWHLISDMEMIRQSLGIESWVLFGGSWGSTLSLLYAQKHPERVTHLVLRGIFLMTQRELDWFYGSGTSAIFPDKWESFIAPIPEAERDDLISAYHKRICSPVQTEEMIPLARAWSIWESSTVSIKSDRGVASAGMDSEFALSFARIEAHYFKNMGFLSEDQQILKNTHRIEHIPTFIVQGRYDAICPPRSAWELKNAMPRAHLDIVPVAGHSAFEPGIQHGLITATDSIVRSDI